MALSRHGNVHDNKKMEQVIISLGHTGNYKQL